MGPGYRIAGASKGSTLPGRTTASSGGGPSGHGVAGAGAFPELAGFAQVRASPQSSREAARRTRDGNPSGLPRRIESVSEVGSLADSPMRKIDGPSNGLA